MKGQAPSPIKVIYILGTPRSGSTLIARLLGELEGFFAAGEIRLLWREVETRRCGCGRPARQCEVWSAALDRVREVDPAEPGDIVQLMRAATPMHQLARLLRPSSRHLHSPVTQRYGRLLATMYRSVADITGSRVIVDSSKSVVEAALLRSVPGVEAYVLHIVRDPRAVVFSWQRALRQHSEGTPYHPTPSLALRWVLTNMTSEAVRRRYAKRGMLLRYEDLVASPQPHVQAIADMVSAPVVDLAFLNDTETPSRARHVVGGNRLRHADEVVRVQEDVDWRSGSSVSVSAQVTALTYPLLRWYRYATRAG